MPLRLPLTARSAILLAALLAAAALAGYLLWRNSPAQAARRCLDHLARTATVYPETSPLQRRLRAGRLAELLADPLEVRVPAAGVSGPLDQEELLSGYLAVALEARYLQVKFSRPELLEHRAGLLQVAARLEVVSDYPADLFPFRQALKVDLVRAGKRLVLARVSADPSRP